MRRVILAIITACLVGFVLSPTPADAAVKRKVTLKVSRSSVSPGATLTLSGKVTKSPRRTKVRIERRTSTSGWKLVKTVRTTTRSGTFSAKTSLRTAGTYTFRARVTAGAGRKAAVSPKRSVKVSVPKKPRPAPPANPPGSQHNPYAAGTTFTLGSWNLRLGRTDTDAWPEIAAENDYNDPPEYGWSYVMVPITATYRGTGFGDPFWDTDVDFLGSDGRVYSALVGNQWCGVVPNAYMDIGDLATGGTATGNECAVVPTHAISGGKWRVSADTYGEYRFVRTY